MNIPFKALTRLFLHYATLYNDQGSSGIIIKNIDYSIGYGKKIDKYISNCKFVRINRKFNWVYSSYTVNNIVNCLMNLNRTKELIHGAIDESKPIEALIHVLESAIELVQIPKNDFAWSHWEDADKATAEINKIISVIETGNLPDRVEVAIIFAPTGPLQEISLSSGWAEPFLKVAEKYDQIEKLLWGSS